MTKCKSCKAKKRTNFPFGKRSKGRTIVKHKSTCKEKNKDE